MNTTSIGQSRCLAARLSCTDKLIITSHIRRQIACTRLSFCRAIVAHPAAQKTTDWLAQPKALVLRDVASYQRNFVSQSFEMLRAHGDSSVKVIISSSAWSQKQLKKYFQWKIISKNVACCTWRVFACTCFSLIMRRDDSRDASGIIRLISKLYQ